uniref:Uncharacterized protein n=1 Tax=Strongyloides venezuelensis TaxID=75913 RepID=A0A0K0EU39_STRVS
MVAKEDNFERDLTLAYIIRKLGDKKSLINIYNIFYNFSESLNIMDMYNTFSFDNDLDNDTEKINIAQNIAIIVNGLPTNNKKIAPKNVDKKLLAEADKINSHFGEKRESIKGKSPCINKKQDNFISSTAETLVDKYLIPQIKKELGINSQSNRGKKQVDKEISFPIINIVHVKNSVKKKEIIKNRSDFKLVSIKKQ